jgi:hypothetical protein
MASLIATETLAELNPEAFLLEGFGDALIGYTETLPNRAVYDAQKCIQILMDRDGVSLQDAQENFDFNCVFAHVGDNSPVIIHLFPAVEVSPNMLPDEKEIYPSAPDEPNK